MFSGLKFQSFLSFKNCWYAFSPTCRARIKSLATSKGTFERLICLTVLDFGRMGCSSSLLGFERRLLTFHPSQFLAHAGRPGEPKISLLEQSPVAVREKNTCILPSCSICLRRLSLNCNWSRLLVSYEVLLRSDVCFSFVLSIFSRWLCLRWPHSFSRYIGTKGWTFLCDASLLLLSDCR